MYDIFLSYSTKDRDRLVPLVTALEQQGWSVFWDHRSVGIGDEWREVIEAAVCQCRCVVVAWSNESLKSKWVKEEATEGGNRKVLLPIRIDDVLPPFGFREIHAGDFSRWNGKTDYPEFVRLTDKIRLLLGQDDAEQERLTREKLAAEQQAREEQERQRRLDEETRRREAAAAANKERVAKEQAATDQKAREAAKQKKLEQQRAAEQKAREEAERQAKAQQEQIKREEAAAEEKARKEAARQAKLNQDPPDKKFPWIPALFLSAAVFGGGGYYWQVMDKPADPEPSPPVVAVDPTQAKAETERKAKEIQANELAQAKAALEANDKTAWSAAVDRLNILATSGNAEAKKVLGIAYYTGTGVDKDQSKGCSLLKQVIETKEAIREQFPKCP